MVRVARQPHFVTQFKHINALYHFSRVLKSTVSLNKIRRGAKHT